MVGTDCGEGSSGSRIEPGEGEIRCSTCAKPKPKEDFTERARSTCSTCVEKKKRQHLKHKHKQAEKAERTRKDNAQLVSVMKGQTDAINQLKSLLTVLSEPERGPSPEFYQVCAQLQNHPSDQFATHRMLQLRVATCALETWKKHVHSRQPMEIIQTTPPTHVAPHAGIANGSTYYENGPMIPAPKRVKIESAEIPSITINESFGVQPLQHYSPCSTADAVLKTENSNSVGLPVEPDLDLDMFDVPFLENDSRAMQTSSSLWATMMTASSAIATSLFHSDSTAMLSFTSDAEGRSMAEQDLDDEILSPMCKFDSCSAPALSTGNASGHSLDFPEISLLLDADKSTSPFSVRSRFSEISLLTWSWVALVPVMVYHSLLLLNVDTFFVNYGAYNEKLRNSCSSQQLLSLGCLLAAFGCSFLPSWAKQLLRPLSLHIDDSHKATELFARWAVVYVCYVMPWIQGALALHTFSESGSILKAVTSHIVAPLCLSMLVLLLRGHVQVIRRVMLLVVFPMFCITQEVAPYEFWCVEIARWHLQGVVMNTSLIVPLQESLFIVAAMLYVNPPGLVSILCIVVAGLIGVYAKIRWIQRDNCIFMEDAIS